MKRRKQLLDQLANYCSDLKDSADERSDIFTEKFARAFSVMTQIESNADIKKSDIKFLNKHYQRKVRAEFAEEYSRVDWKIVDEKLKNGKNTAFEYVYECLTDRYDNNDKAAVKANELIRKWREI